MSRGKLITVTLWWSAAMWMSMVTSLLPSPELPASSSLVEKAPPCPVRVSVPVRSRLTPPSIAPTFATFAVDVPGRWESWMPFTSLARPHTAMAAIDTELIATTATAIPSSRRRFPTGE